MLEEKLVKLLQRKYRIMSFDKESRRLKIRKSIRSKISGTKERPRISVFRSNKSIYSQIIDDTNGHTLVSSSSSDVKMFGKNNLESCKKVGLSLQRKLRKKESNLFYSIEVVTGIMVESNPLQMVQEKVV